MVVKLLTEHHLEFLSLSGGFRGPTESIFVKMSNCWESLAAAHRTTSSVLIAVLMKDGNYNLLS